MKVELTCNRCEFIKAINIEVDEDGVYSVPNKYCPNCLHLLAREIIVARPVSNRVIEPESETVQEPESETVQEPESETVQEPESETVQEPDGQAETDN